MVGRMRDRGWGGMERIMGVREMGSERDLVVWGWRKAVCSFRLDRHGDDVVARGTRRATVGGWVEGWRTRLSVLECPDKDRSLAQDDRLQPCISSTANEQSRDCPAWVTNTVRRYCTSRATTRIAILHCLARHLLDQLEARPDVHTCQLLDQQLGRVWQRQPPHAR
jgi:hypothetical protein